MAMDLWSSCISVKTIAVLGMPLGRGLRSLAFLSGQ